MKETPNTEAETVAAFAAVAAAASQAAATLGRIGGAAKSPAKQEAARENGKRGGRPRKVLYYVKNRYGVRMEFYNKRIATEYARLEMKDGYSATVEALDGRLIYPPAVNWAGFGRSE